MASELNRSADSPHKKLPRPFAPDVLVVKGVGKHKRRVYKLWEEQAVVPCTLFEITSKQTAQADLTTKYQLYEWLGVKEYFLFDLLAEYLQPSLQGFVLVQGRYQALPLSSEGELVSRELSLILRPQGDLLSPVGWVSEASPNIHFKNPGFFKNFQIDSSRYAIIWNEDIDISEYEIWSHGTIEC